MRRGPYPAVGRYRLKKEYSFRPQLCLKPRTIIVVLIIALFILVYRVQLPQRRIKIPTDMLILQNPVKFKNIKCHLSREGDALPSAGGAGFEPAPGSIFFHETSCRSGLNSRQACAVESAARAHPRHQIHVLFSAPVTQDVLEKSCLSILRQLQNVDFHRVHVQEYVKGTPVESTLAEVAMKSRYPMEHTADMIRLVTLFKWGGVYLDTDVVVLKSFESLPPNWIAGERPNRVSTGIMSFMKDEVGRNFTGAVLKEISSTYSPNLWSFNGPFAIIRVLQKMCPELNQTFQGNCNGIGIFGPDMFYSVYYMSASKYFEPGDVDMEGPYTHHLWNKMTWNSTVNASSPYAKLARRYCPTIYEAFGDKFGV